MKSRPLTFAIAAVLAAGATGAAAQTYGQSYQTYQHQYSTYQAQQAAYNEARNAYERQRAAYDATYGYGAYARIYGPFSYTAPSTYGYGYGSTNPYSSSPYSTSPYSNSPYAASPYSSYPYTSGSGSYGSNPYYAGAYGANASYGGMACSTGGSGSVNLSLLSSLAQAALSGRSGGNVVNEAIMGAVVDRALGSRAISNAQCDSGGYYYTYAQTQPYREGYHDAYGRWVETSGSAAYANCRIAPAPVDAAGSSWRYVRVCPDATGRYRIATG